MLLCVRVSMKKKKNGGAIARGRSCRCPKGERERGKERRKKKKSCCLLPLCKLASDKGFYRRATKRVCDGSAGQNGRGEEGLWGKDRDKIPISVSTAIMLHSPPFHPSLPHTHDPVINLLEISRSLINACPPSFPLAFFFFFDCIKFWVFSPSNPRTPHHHSFIRCQLFCLSR